MRAARAVVERDGLGQSGGSETPLERDSPVSAANSDVVSAFRRIYFYLYSNSRASRAERILEDVCLLLLSKLASELNDSGRSFAAFSEGKLSAAELARRSRAAFPNASGEEPFHLDDEHLRRAASELKDIRLSGSAAHVLGEAFQALIGPKIRGDKGQFFTPRSLVRAMVEVLDVKPGESVLDPACGTGGFLYEALSYVSARHDGTIRAAGVDKDKDLARLATALLTIAGNKEPEIQCRNSLEPQAWSGADNRFDVVLTNPPFGAKISIDDPAILSGFDLGHEWQRSSTDGSWKKTERVLSAQDPQILFIELCIRRLKLGGRLGIVLPEGIFGNSQDGYIWDFVRSMGRITALLDCPRTTFQPGTDTKTNVLFFERSKVDVKSIPSTVDVAVALTCGHDRRGRTVRADGKPLPDDFSEIAQDFRRKNRNRWSRVDLRNPYYLVPRYYIDEAIQSDYEARITSRAEVFTIGELEEAGLIRVRKGNEVGSEAYGTGDVPFVRTSDISNFEISTDPTKSVSDEIYERFAPQQQLRHGSLLMVVDGRYRIGATAIITERTVKCVVQSHIKIIDAVPGSGVDPYALLFALGLPTVRRRLRDLVFVQSTLGTLGKRLLELKIPALWVAGPWSERIAQFRDTLGERDRLLAELSSMAQDEVEL